MNQFNIFYKFSNSQQTGNHIPRSQDQSKDVIRLSSNVYQKPKSGARVKLVARRGSDCMPDQMVILRQGQKEKNKKWTFETSYLYSWHNLGHSSSLICNIFIKYLSKPLSHQAGQINQIIIFCSDFKNSCQNMSSKH